MPVLCREASAMVNDADVLDVFERHEITPDRVMLIEHPDYPKYNRVVVAGLDAYEARRSEREALRAEQDRKAAEIRERGGFMTPRQRDDMLCAMQRRQFARGLREFKLSTNIYGWCVEKTTNLGGGMAAQTRRGLNKAEAIEWGIEWAKKDPSKRFFTIYVEYLPEGFDMSEAA